MAICGISPSQILMDTGQVCTLDINTPRYIRRQSLSICCLQKASMVLKLQSLSSSFQVSLSTASHRLPDMDLSARPSVLLWFFIPNMLNAPLRQHDVKKKKKKYPRQILSKSRILPWWTGPWKSGRLGQARFSSIQRRKNNGFCLLNGSFSHHCHQVLAHDNFKSVGWTYSTCEVSEVNFCRGT